MGQPQEPLDSKRKQLYRYRLSGTGEGLNKSYFACNDDKYNPQGGYVANDVPTALSNWSVANEIARLARQNTVVNWDSDYDFHYVGCDDKDITPFSSPETFSAYGLSKSNSQRWKCNTCKKITNTLPDQNSCYTYRQKRNEIIVAFADLIVRGIAVKEVCGLLVLG